MKLTFEKFQITPIKIRILFIKQLLNILNYSLENNYYDDKKYKKALKHWQTLNGFSGNCVISKDVFYCLIDKINQISNANDIWININRGE